MFSYEVKKLDIFFLVTNFIFLKSRWAVTSKGMSFIFIIFIIGFSARNLQEPSGTFRNQQEHGTCSGFRRESIFTTHPFCHIFKIHSFIHSFMSSPFLFTVKQEESDSLIFTWSNCLDSNQSKQNGQNDAEQTTSIFNLFISQNKPFIAVKVSVGAWIKLSCPSRYVWEDAMEACFSAVDLSYWPRSWIMW